MAAAGCCCDGVPVFDGMDPRYKRVLWIVIGINGAMFLTEMTAGQLAGSQALKADALDFLADTVTYGLSLAVIGATLRTRASAALLKGLSLSAMALSVFGSTVYQTLVLGLPKYRLARLAENLRDRPSLSRLDAFIAPASAFLPAGMPKCQIAVPRAFRCPDVKPRSPCW